MTSNVAMVLVTSAGSASDALNSSTNIATCKPKGYPSVKQPKRWTFPEPRFKRGAHGRIGLMPVPMWWSFLSAFLVLPSSIDWSWLSMWCLSKSAHVGFAWSAACER